MSYEERQGCTMSDGKGPPMVDEIGYACPMCGGVDLRAEVPAIVTMDSAGKCELQHFEAVTEHVGALTPEAYANVLVACQAEDCEHAGSLVAFEVTAARLPAAGC